VTTDLPPTAQQAPPRMFGQRSYVLPDDVHTNLPHRPSDDAEPGEWHRARGLLIELCRQLDATPVALYLRSLRTPIGNPDGVVVTAIARDQHDQIHTVVWRHQLHPQGPALQPEGHLTVDGMDPPYSTGKVPPTAPWMARLAVSILDG
jgi:hypothetical protein